MLPFVRTFTLTVQPQSMHAFNERVICSVWSPISDLIAALLRFTQWTVTAMLPFTHWTNGLSFIVANDADFNHKWIVAFLFCILTQFIPLWSVRLTLKHTIYNYACPVYNIYRNEQLSWFQVGVKLDPTLAKGHEDLRSTTCVPDIRQQKKHKIILKYIIY